MGPSSGNTAAGAPASGPKLFKIETRWHSNDLTIETMFGTDGVVETDYKDFVSDGGGANPTFKFTLHLQAYMKEAADPENGLPETKKLRQE